MAIVYILTNESMLDIIKIGITDNLSRRLRELDNTSTPLPFECFYAVEVDDGDIVVLFESGQQIMFSPQPAIRKLKRKLKFLKNR